MNYSDGLVAGRSALVTGTAQGIGLAEVAGAVLFLASYLSSYMTGAVLEVGGGRLM